MLDIKQFIKQDDYEGIYTNRSLQKVKKEEKRNLYLESCQILYLIVLCTVELVQSDTSVFRHPVTSDKNLWSQSISLS